MIANKQETLDSLSELFRKRFNELIFDSPPFGSADTISEYLNRLNPSVLGCSLNALLEIVNFDDRRFYIIRNPYNNSLFLAVERGFAEKVLVLGLP